MARGQQKIQAQQKNADKNAKQKKGNYQEQKKAAKAALVYTCTVCKVRGDVCALTLAPKFACCIRGQY